MSTTTTTPPARPDARALLNKVPEVTLWFWVIKILCTTVGESFADYVNETLGFGLTNTTILFTVVFVVVLGAQLRAPRYVPGLYWLTVVVVSVTGTLYTDILTDQLAVPLWISSAVFSALLAVVFGIWYARERTLSIHSIVTLPREAFYWLAVLVTFALGTATGDWTLTLTGWGAGTSILLPATLIAITVVGWRMGGNAVLCFWVAYILTRPLGANIGDFLASPRDPQDLTAGLGLGTLGTSLVFLGAILATVVYLTVSKVDVIGSGSTATPAVTDAHRRLGRERAVLALFGVVAVGTAGLLTYTDSQPHASALDDAPAPSCSAGNAPTDDAAAHQLLVQRFPAADVTTFATLTKDIRTAVDAGDARAAGTAATALESAWDKRADALTATDCQAWTYVDQRIDPVLSSVRAHRPEQATEDAALTRLARTLGG
ncbi:hypothetical protein K8Z61_11130 [Nocardioides sp. TRM66260-LWL]|uniref:COG4705 family protein n=1 Tax=Nocardioides sp. TRM66260-LWL TaxID=2874478 RepID=UPI001CC681D7|nr:hypothetical protein [Nocardioides sp. TRM66260-LWL]MBZ5735051.1 hypothetical protein [Nocardioides sp. TRM66260-LWL]